MPSPVARAFFGSLVVAVAVGALALFLLGSRDPWVLALMRGGWLLPILLGVSTLAFWAVGHSAARAWARKRETLRGRVTALGVLVAIAILLFWIAMAAFACRAGLCDVPTLPR